MSERVVALYQKWLFEYYFSYYLDQISWSFKINVYNFFFLFYKLVFKFLFFLFL